MVKGVSKKKSADGRRPPFKTLTIVAVGVNVSLLVGLFPASMVLWHRRGRGARCEETQGQSGVGDGLRPRYCFRQDRLQCLDNGHEVKVQGNLTLCCGNLGERMFGLMSEVSWLCEWMSE